jgi:hypothetical protein
LRPPNNTLAKNPLVPDLSKIGLTVGAHESALSVKTYKNKKLPLPACLPQPSGMPDGQVQPKIVRLAWGEDLTGSDTSMLAIATDPPPASA